MKTFHADVYNIVRDMQSEPHPFRIPVHGYFPEIYSEFNDKSWFVATPQDFHQEDRSFYSIRITCYNMPEFYIDLPAGLIFQVLQKRQPLSVKTGQLLEYKNPTFQLSCDEDDKDILPEFIELCFHKEPSFLVRISLDSLRKAKIATMVFFLPEHFEELSDSSDRICSVCSKRLFFHTHDNVADCLSVFNRIDFIS